MTRVIDKTIHVPPPSTPRPEADPPPVRLPPADPDLIGTKYSPIIWPSFMQEALFCGHCGTATVEYWKSESGFNVATGKRNGRRAARCPHWRWWKPWHASGYWVLREHDGSAPPPPPPPEDRG